MREAVHMGHGCRASSKGDAMDQIIWVLVPAYNPDEERLEALTTALRSENLPMIIIDDGCGEAYRPLFERLERLGAMVVRHAVNLGKGRALKTGINALLAQHNDFFGVITADADGQHSARDILRVRSALLEQPDSLIIGARRFTGNVPFKSRAGNAVTRVVYRYVSGIRCRDTQSGLRAIPARALPSMLYISGERYEYEMNMLLQLRELSLQLREIEIETLYFNNNQGSHFRPLHDAARIYSVILRFALSSILSFCVDYSAYLLLLFACSLSPVFAYGIARSLSSLLNFAINREVVFGKRGGKWAVFRYYALVAVQMLAGMGLVNAISNALSFSPGWVKVPVDLLLFFGSYILQRDFVFGSK